MAILILKKNISKLHEMFINVSFEMLVLIFYFVSGLGFLGDPPDNGMT